MQRPLTYYTKITRAFKARTDINPAAKLIYPELSYRMNLSRQKGKQFFSKKYNAYYVIFSVAELRKRCGMKRSQTLGGLKSLCNAGLVDKKPGCHCNRLFLPKFDNRLYQNQVFCAVREPRPRIKTDTDVTSHTAPASARDDRRPQTQPTKVKVARPVNQKLLEKQSKLDMKTKLEHTANVTWLHKMLEAIKTAVYGYASSFDHVFSLFLRAKKHLVNVCTRKYRKGSLKLKLSLRGLRFENNLDYYEEPFTTRHVYRIIRLAHSQLHYKKSPDKYMMCGFIKIFKAAVHNYWINNKPQPKGPDVPLFKI